MNFNDVTRRQLFGTGIGLGMAGVAAGAFAAIPAPVAMAPGVSSGPIPASLHRRGLLMRGLLREGLQYSALRGTFYAVENGQTTPLLGAVMATFSKNWKLPDGSIESRMIEMEWYTDLDGVIFDTWKNPITNKVATHPERKYFRHTIITGPDLSRKSLTLGSRYMESVLGWREDGDDLWMFNQLSTLPADPAAKGPTGVQDMAVAKGNVPVATELATYHARVSEIDAPGATNVRIESYHSCEGAYRPWEQMGNLPGYQLLIVCGRSLNSRDELPKDWVAKTEKVFPELMKSPEALLDA
jgi:hypothetical protein